LKLKSVPFVDVGDSARFSGTRYPELFLESNEAIFRKMDDRNESSKLTPLFHAQLNRFRSRKLAKHDLHDSSNWCILFLCGPSHENFHVAVEPFGERKGSVRFMEVWTVSPHASVPAFGTVIVSMATFLQH
jgi:hypothetical protein